MECERNKENSYKPPFLFVWRSVITMMTIHFPSMADCVTNFWPVRPYQGAFWSLATSSKGESFLLFLNFSCGVWNIDIISFYRSLKNRKKEIIYYTNNILFLGFSSNCSCIYTFSYYSCWKNSEFLQADLYEHKQ